MRRRLILVVTVGAAASLAFLTPIVLSLAAPPTVAQASAGLGLSVNELVVGLGSILAVVVAPLVGAIVKVSNSKDEALKGQAEAHRADIAARDLAFRTEREGLYKMLEKERDRNERQATAFSGTLGEVSKKAMDVVDGFRRDVAAAFTTPDTPNTPPARDSRTGPPSVEGSGPPTRRGRRNSGG